MPEGDTVYRSARALNAALAGQPLVRCDIRVPAFATVDLSGTVVSSVVSRGKHLLMRVGDYSIHSHLSMEGSWHLYGAGSQWRRPLWQARAILANEQIMAVGFQLGLIEVILLSEEEATLGHLGPDLLGPDWNVEVALERLARDPHRAIGLAILDQRVLAGLGNVYRNELLFLRGILPTRPVGEVEEPRRLLELAHRLINANKDRAQRTTTGNLRGTTIWVYRRQGSQCLRCGTPIERGQLGESELLMRDIYWCPRCQK